MSEQKKQVTNIYNVKLSLNNDNYQFSVYQPVTEKNYAKKEQELKQCGFKYIEIVNKYEKNFIKGNLYVSPQNMDTKIMKRYEKFLNKNVDLTFEFEDKIKNGKQVQTPKLTFLKENVSPKINDKESLYVGSLNETNGEKTLKTNSGLIKPIGNVLIQNSKLPIILIENYVNNSKIVKTFKDFVKSHSYLRDMLFINEETNEINLSGTIFFPKNESNLYLALTRNIALINQEGVPYKENVTNEIIQVFKILGFDIEKDTARSEGNYLVRKTLQVEPELMKELFKLKEMNFEITTSQNETKERKNLFISIPFRYDEEIKGSPILNEIVKVNEIHVITKNLNFDESKLLKKVNFKNNEQEQKTEQAPF